MSLPKEVVREFLARKLDNHVWMKTLSEEKVDEAIAALTPPPVFRTKPRLHQKVCFLLGLAYPEFFFQLDMGTGKTYIVLMLLDYFMQIKLCNRAVVLVPVDEAVWGWEEQIQEHAPGVPYVCMTGSSAEKWDTYKHLHQGLAITTYMGLVHMVCGRTSIIIKDKKTGAEKDSGKKKLQPVLKKVEEFCDGIDALIMDESTVVGNHSSLPYRVCNAISKRTEIHYALAGRPFGRDPTLVWSQYNLVDRGFTLGPTLGLFRGVFFTEKPGWFGGWEYKFDRTMEEDLARTLAHRSIQYTARECVDLPPVVRIVEKVAFPAATETYYKQVIDRVKAAKGNYKEIQNSFIMMRQISSGFMGFTDDDTGEKAQVEFDDNPKLDRMLERVEEALDGHKQIIFYEFTWSGRRIFEALNARKINARWIWSGTEDSKKDIHDFKTKKKPEVLVLQSRIGAFSLNLQVASYSHYYESPIPVIVRDQSEKRTERDGQLSDKVFMIDYVVRGTMDDKILRFHKEGRDLYEAMKQEPELLYED